jgi:hypothetical protein
VRFDVVSVEFAGGHRYRAGGQYRRGLFAEPVGVSRRQHDGRTGSESHRELGANFAAAAENQHRMCARVIHGCDYHLR